MKKLALVPIGEVDQTLVRDLSRELDFFKLRTVTEMPEPEPAYAYESSRNQYRSSMILHRLRSRSINDDIVLGVTSVDLFSKNLTFVFGEAEVGGKVAVISLVRLRPEFYGRRADYGVFLKRVKKEAVHEIGHVLGLKHCENLDCVMRFSENIKDTDNKNGQFCGRCQQKLKS